jgi:Tol biopolymer transport system component
MKWQDRLAAFDTLDRLAGALIACLLGALAFTIVSGDRAGLNISVLNPPPGKLAGHLHGNGPLRLAFSELIDPASLDERWQITPPMEGRFIWSGAQLTFQPWQGWLAGQTYEVRLNGGVRALSGRLLRGDFTFQFSARAPHIAYLAEADFGGLLVDNLFISALDGQSEPRLLTQSTTGIVDYQPSPDGQFIAYGQMTSEGREDLFTVEVATGKIRQITDCASANATCSNPGWSPDGGRLAYERREFSELVPQGSERRPRTWLVNLADLSTTPLLETDAWSQAPRWSSDGSKIAVFDLNRGGIMIYDLATGEAQFASSLEAQSGLFVFDRTGQKLVYPELVASAGQFTADLVLIDLANPAAGVLRLSGEDRGLVDDNQPAWHPDGMRLVFTHRVLDGSSSFNPQLYVVNTTTLEVSPLVVDDAFFHGAPSFSPAGDMLLLQRFPAYQRDGAPSIWVYNMVDGQLRQIAERAYLPKWLP